MSSSLRSVVCVLMVAKISRADGSESSVFPIDSITGNPNA